MVYRENMNAVRIWRLSIPTAKDGDPKNSSAFVINWCPVIVSNRQQVSPILSLAVISLLIDQ